MAADLADLAYQVADLRRTVGRLEAKLGNGEAGVFLRTNVYEAHQDTWDGRLSALEAQIERIEDAQTWAMRLILTNMVGVVAAIISAILLVGLRR